MACSVVTVKVIPPGAPAPSPAEADYYVSMLHDREHYTFIDSLTEEPPSKALYANQQSQRVGPDSGFHIEPAWLVLHVQYVQGC